MAGWSTSPSASPSCAPTATPTCSSATCRNEGRAGPMNATLVVEQALNGLQFGLMLFLLAAGLTIVFGVMDMINLAHGSLYMVGAFIAAWLAARTGSFWLGMGGAIALTALIGMALEVTLLRTLYARDH